MTKKILVVFGSKSDEKVFGKIAKSLKGKADFDIRICSAHRTPELLNTVMLKKDYDLIIAGAGLAAHLPGVIASKTTAPVVGVPVSGNFDGLDAFLSIVQMPSGIPVLACPVDSNPISDFLLFDYDSVKVVGDMKNERVKKCVVMLEEFDVALDLKKPITINFFNLDTENPKENCINVPLLEGDGAEDALSFFKKANKGYFVGLNRGDNAAVFAVSMIDRYSLIDYRDDMKQKVVKDDKEVISN
ncbi:AIR carboxylase family protein [Candidatus Woesearchaeota archaeon]|nr:AIR carboxylase family protein [Candidatus Woesearchaeota archaeon]